MPGTAAMLQSAAHPELSSEFMRVLINGRQTDITDGCSMADLLHDLGFAGQRIAVELNGEILPRSLHTECHIRPDDRIEIVHAIGGGAF
jgi:sulfur carrier protein